MTTASKSRLQTLIQDGNTSPGDILTIRYFPGLSSEVTFTMTNENDPGYSETRSASNTTALWKFLKQFNEIAGRKVLIEEEDGSVIPLVESIAYVHRFISQEKARQMFNAKRIA